MAVKKAVKTADIKTDESVPAEGAVRVTSPAGFVTDVPESIVDALIESGYTK